MACDEPMWRPDPAAFARGCFGDGEEAHERVRALAYLLVLAGPEPIRSVSEWTPIPYMLEELRHDLLRIVAACRQEPARQLGAAASMLVLWLSDPPDCDATWHRHALEDAAKAAAVLDRPGAAAGEEGWGWPAAAWAFGRAFSSLLPIGSRWNLHVPDAGEVAVEVNPRGVGAPGDERTAAHVEVEVAARAATSRGERPARVAVAQLFTPEPPERGERAWSLVQAVMRDVDPSSGRRGHAVSGWTLDRMREFLDERVGTARPADSRGRRNGSPGLDAVWTKILDTWRSRRDATPAEAIVAAWERAGGKKGRRADSIVGDLVRSLRSRGEQVEIPHTRSKPLLRATCSGWYPVIAGTPAQ